MCHQILQKNTSACSFLIRILKEFSQYYFFPGAGFPPSGLAHHFLPVFSICSTHLLEIHCPALSKVYENKTHLFILSVDFLLWG